MTGHFEMEFLYLLGSTDPCPTTVHMEPFSTSNLLLEYLLLPPKSALEVIPPRLTPKASPQPPHPPTCQWMRIDGAQVT